MHRRTSQGREGPAAVPEIDTKLFLGHIGGQNSAIFAGNGLKKGSAPSSR